MEKKMTIKSNDNQPTTNPNFIGDELIAAFARATDYEGKPPVTVHYISDNGGYPDTAKIEVQKRLADINAILSTHNKEPAPETIYHDIPSQDWRAGAFDLAQIARDTVRGPGNVVFLNCAPRRKEREQKTDNEGEGVFIGMLRNGTVISAVSEDSFALFRDLIEDGDLEIYRANVQTKGSQFRSRDYFPWLSQLTAFEMQKANDWKEDLNVDERREFLKRLNFVDTNSVLSLEHITDFKQEPCILRADCHGNFKLSIRTEDVRDIPLNTLLRVNVNGKEHQAVLKKGMFDPNEQSLFGLASGSSGDWADSREGKFLELALMGKSIKDEWGISAQNLKEGVSVNIIGPVAQPATTPSPQEALQAV